MGKRKGSVPQKASEAKRQQLSWDLKDLERNFDLSIVDNTDPSLQQEASDSNRILNEIRKNQDVLEAVDSGYTSTGSLAVEERAAVQNLLDECKFYLTVGKDPALKQTEWTCALGTFLLDLDSPKQRPIPHSMPDVDKFWLYVNVGCGKHLVYFETNDNVSNSTGSTQTDNKQIVYYNAETKLSQNLLEGLRMKCFKLGVANYDHSAGRLGITIYVTQGALTSLHFPSEGYRTKKLHKTLSGLMAELYDLQVTDFSSHPFAKKHNVDDLYAEVKQRHLVDDLYHIKVNVQHPGLKPRLRDYQKQTVLWMLSKERFQPSNQSDDENVEKKDDLHCLYKEIVTPEGQTLYFNTHGGYLVREKPLAVTSPPGGILAEEMGLGKTVEVLCCMLLHPRLGLPKVEPLPVLGEDEFKEVTEQSTASDMSPGTGNHVTDDGMESDNVAADLDGLANGCISGDSNVCSASGVVLGETGTSLECSDIQQQVPTEIVPEEGKVTNCLSGEEASEDHREELPPGELPPGELPPGEYVEEIPIGEHYVIDHSYCDRKVNSPASGEFSEENKAKIIRDQSSYMYSGEASDMISLDELDIANEISVIDGNELLNNCNSEIDGENAIPSCAAYEMKHSDQGYSVVDDATKMVSDSHMSNVSPQGLEINNDIQEATSSGSKKKRRKKKGRKSRKNLNRSDSSSTDQSNCSISSKEKTKKRRKRETFVNDAEQEAKNIFTEKLKPQTKKFECLCGKLEGSRRDAVLVECCRCGLGQHADCVNYDVRDPYRGRYLCPHCHTNSSPIPSGATLIITPNSISHQWIEEIRKHIREESINVLVYTGVHKLGFVQPQTLAQKDIVITTYETLRKEVDYVDLPHSNSDSGRRFRHPKRFMAIPSPIVAVEWWRICLDEAQMVEVTTTKTAEMALRLKAVNRWCVTGTPIQRGIDDLYGLFLFLGLEPYWVQQWWQKILYEPFCYGHKTALFSALHEALWRTAKADVLDQICLPMQTEEQHWLTFSPVEEHFYRRQYQDCAKEALQKLSKWTDSTTKLNSLDRYTLHQLLHPLVRLRQACCHPQAVRGEFLPIHKSTMTMEELLKQLIKKVQLECEESHRQWVFAMNGLAALDLIQDKVPDAVDKYRTVLRSVEENKVEVRTDELQQLHTLHNLDEVLASKPAGVPPTLRDHQLQQQMKEIKMKYIARFTQQVVQAQDSWAPVQKSLREITNQFKRGRDWWIELLQWIVYANLDQSLVEKVKDDLVENRRPGDLGMNLRFRNVRGLEYVIGIHLDELQTTHENLVKMIRTLSREPSWELITQTVECCLRPADKVLKTCPFCKADELFQGYESKLFSFVEKGVVDQAVEGEDPSYSVSTRRQGTWADSEAERALKTLLSFSKNWAGDRECIEHGAVHMKLLETLKKEFKCLRTMWLYLRERVSALDELNMATMRMRLRFPDEPKTDPPQQNILERLEMEPHRLKLDTDRIIGKNGLKKKLGQLLYLRNLAMAQTPLDGGLNPSPCPICQKKLGKKWCVLVCGHCYCLECIQTMVDMYSFGRQNRSMKCPICRQRTTHAEISYVSTRGSHTGMNEDIRVKGDHSTKLEGIVSCLLKIHQEDPQAKSLVFSTWSDVLELLETALRENNISFKSLHGSYKFQKNLETFKHSSEVQVLLLPVKSGANGLNLIEATHVLLVEPILNPAQELQAIGRVHRIGQTKPTVVHRFLVRGTIEEKMHFLLQSVQKPTNSHNTEETTLTIGELSTLFAELPHVSDGEDDDEDGSEVVMETINKSQNHVAIDTRDRVHADGGGGLLGNTEPILATKQVKVDGGQALSSVTESVSGQSSYNCEATGLTTDDDSAENAFLGQTSVVDHDATNNESGTSVNNDDHNANSNGQISQQTLP